MSALGITDQVRRACLKTNRLAAICGGVLGAFIPAATFTLAHYEAGLDTWRAQAALGFVAAGLAYSATTVYGWARVAFGAVPKALGFVVLLEGALVLARSTWLSGAALALLVTINALAAACALATDQKEARRVERAKATPRPALKVVRPVKAPARKKVRR